MSKKELELKYEQLHEAVQKAIATKKFAENFENFKELMLEMARVHSQLMEFEFEELKKKQIEADNKVSEMFNEINNNSNNFNNFIKQFL